MIQPVPPPVPPPPIVSSIGPSSFVASIVSYEATDVVCDGELAAFVARARPFASSATSYGGGDPKRPAPVTLSFRIDEAGRPMSIVRERVPAAGETLYADTSDLEPALAVSRFSNRARTGCRVTFVGTAVPIELAAPELLVEFASGPLAGPNAPRARARLIAGGSCGVEGAFRPRTLNFPDLERIKPLVPSQSFVAVLHDIDASGRPVRLRMISLDDAAPLVAEVRRAIGSSLFAAKPLTNCLAMFRMGQKEESPPPPRPAPMLKSAASCPSSAPRPELAGEPQFPLAFRRRGVEGWADLGYDVAPWGEFGNMKVLASEPAEGFGAAAMAVLQRVKRVPSGVGRSGCVQSFSYRLPPGGSPSNSPDASSERQLDDVTFD